MMKYITMKNFLQNPSGKSSAGFARRDLIIANLIQRYNNLITKHGSFYFSVWEEKDDFVFYFKIPSEEYGMNLYYDVVIKYVCTKPDMMKTMLNISSYSLNVFSNSPNFLFTYAYIYNKDGIIPSSLKGKVGLTALNNPPDIKNPTQTYGFEKSVYFALLFIKHHNLINKSYIRSLKTNYIKGHKLSDEIKNIKSCTEKHKEYNKLKSDAVKARKAEREKVKKQTPPPAPPKKFSVGKGKNNMTYSTKNKNNKKK